MDVNLIEELVIKAKDGDMKAKEEIIDSFKLLIYKLSHNTYINGLTPSDIEHECYISLLKAIKSYDTNKHRFVAYCTNSIKNNLYSMVRKSVTHNKHEGDERYEYKDWLGYNITDLVPIDQNIIDDEETNSLNMAIKSLSHDDLEIINELFYKNRAIKEYAYVNHMLYQSVYNKKRRIIKKLNEEMMKNY